MEWSLQGYINVLGALFWPIFFSVIVGYIYFKNQSLVVMAAAILIIVSIFGEFIVVISPIYSLFYILTALIISLVILLFFVKRRVG